MNESSLGEVRSKPVVITWSLHPERQGDGHVEFRIRSLPLPVLYKSAPVLCSPLADANNYELRWFRHGDAYEANQTSVIEVVLGHRGPVTLNKKCLFRPIAL